MTKQKLFIYIAAGLFLMLALMTLPYQVDPVVGEGLQQQTWPSRTPTPQGGPQPTATNPPPTNDPGGGPPPPTSTPQSDPNSTPVGSDPTATTAVTVIVSTPEGGYDATAQPCGVPPTVKALGLVNVRLGPGLDYEAVSNLVYLEVRPIIGRAEFSNWWLIQLPGNDTGWVADQAVTVQGYTGIVPIVAPPALNGVTPTPGPLWEPTPNPICTPLPTPTPTIAPTVEEAQQTTVSVSNPTPTEAPPEPTNTPTEQVIEPAPSDTAEPQPSAVPTEVPPTPDTGSPITEEANSNSDNDSPTSTSSMILFIGIGLVIVAGATYVLRSR